MCKCGMHRELNKGCELSTHLPLLISEELPLLTKSHVRSLTGDWGDLSQQTFNPKLVLDLHAPQGTGCTAAWRSSAETCKRGTKAKQFILDIKLSSFSGRDGYCLEARRT